MSATTALAPPPSAAPPPALPAIVPPLPIRRFTVDEYHRMIQAGILGEYDEVELLEGWIVPKMPKSPPHDAMISIIMMDVLMPRLPANWHCRGQSAIDTTDSEPEPDIVVVRGFELDYMTRHPAPADIALSVEVSDSSLARDRTEKARIYARAAVPVYWIINLIDREVEVFTDPTGPDAAPSYRMRRVYRPGDMVPFVVDGRELGPIPVGELLP